MARPAARLVALALVIPMAMAAACDRDEAGDGGGDDRPAATTTTTAGATAGANESTDDAGVIELEIAGGGPAGGIRRETVKLGSQVTLRVTSDAAGEIHVHTYDLKADIVAGQSTDLTFVAKIPGVFEVELENLRKKVLELEVSS